MSHHMEWVISGYYSNYGLDNNKKLQCCCWMGGGATLRIINNMNMAQLITFIMGGLTDVDHNNIIDREFGKAALLACRYLDT